jgi:CheY-like chemotaxis protein
VKEMNPINILVIDDEKDSIENLMRMLKRKDKLNKIGEIIVDDSMLKDVKSLEEFSLSKYDIKFDVILIDHQLGCGFSGALVSAWMLIQKIRAPRITFTGAEYPGPKEYFDENIIKDEITTNAQDVINRIVSCVENFKYDEWLVTQYDQLVNEYTKLLKEDQSGSLSYTEKTNLESLESILDKFESIIDSKQNEFIKLRYKALEVKGDFTKKNNEFLSQLEVKEREMNQIIEELRGKLNG